MPQNATNRQSRGGLAPNQILALERLLAGDTVTAAAQAAGVCRETVQRWKNDDGVFRAAMNQRLLECQEATFTRLHEIGMRATRVVSDAIDRGNLKAALAVLKGLGVLTGTLPWVGATNPEDAEFEARLAEDKKNTERMNRFMLSP